MEDEGLPLDQVPGIVGELVAPAPRKLPRGRNKGLRFNTGKIKTVSPDTKAKMIQIVAMSVRGKSAETIAEKIGMDAERVKKLRDRGWLQAAPIDHIAKLRQIELGKLEKLEEMILQDLDLSRKGENGKKLPRDPRLYKCYLDVLSARRSMAGLDRPTKVQVDEKKQVLQIKATVVKTHEEAKAALARLEKKE